MVTKKVMVVRIPKAVLPLIIINVFVFILQNVLGMQFTQMFYLDTATAFVRPWTLLTAMFLHGDITHILFNMYALLMFGPLIEQRVGTKNFLNMYFLSGLIASAGYVFWQEIILGTSAVALGASGAIMGVLGMTIVLLPNLRVLFFFIIPMSMRTAGIIFALIDVIGVFTPNNVANIAHLFGLAAGMLFARYLLKQKKKFDKEFARPYKQSTTMHFRNANAKKQYGDSIELNEDDIQNYLKKGRL